MTDMDTLTFDGIAKVKLDDILKRGWSICGYAIQKDGEYGLVTTGAFVGWWTVAHDNASNAEAEVARLTAALSEERGKGVGIGMAIAAGIIVSAHGAEVEAEEVLGAAGMTTIKALRAQGVDEYDIELLAPVLKTFRDHASWGRKVRAAAIRSRKDKP